MIRAELQLRPAPDAMRETRAYLLVGDDPAGWMATVAAWRVKMAAVRLYVLPRSISDLAPAAALAVGKSLPHDVESPACLPYGALAGGRLYLPIDSVLTPAVSDDEIRRMLPGHLYVLHPSAGLVGFAETDAISLHQLIDPPAIAARAWNRAVPGLAGCPHLRSVTVPPMPELVEILDQGRDDIAGQTPGDIPALSDDPGGSVLGRVAGKAFLGMMGVFKLIDSFLFTDIAGDRSEGWLHRKMSAVSKRLEEARFKELARLMRLMETDPDRALRYALPMGGQANRGLAQPGGQLMERSTQFNLGMLQGGQAADYWDMPWQYQQKLIQQYRQAANREIALGRHRRAAYIYAVLLGDYHSAANVLRQGRCFREAAAIYKDHLHNPLEAARCLEQGGLLIEAIELYEQREQYEKVGDLYTTLEQPDRAEQAYRRAVDQARRDGKVVAAAGILDKKLGAIDEADELFAGTWPDGPQAMECLRARYALLGRAGRHGRCRALTDQLRKQAPPHRAVALTGSLALIARDYPDQPTRHSLADAVRVISSRCLATAGAGDAAAVTSAVARLCPQDRLLKRDASRFLAARSRRAEPAPEKSRPQPVPSSKTARRVQRTQRHDLPEEIEWTTFAAGQAAWFAVGFRKEGAFKSGLKGVQVLARFAHTQQHMQMRQLYRGDEQLLTALDPTRQFRLMLTSLQGRRLTQRDVPFADTTLSVGMSSWAPDGIAGLAFDHVGQVWMLILDGAELRMAIYSPEGELRHSVGLGIYLGTPSLPMVIVRDGKLWFAMGDSLFQCHTNGRAEITQTPSTILSLSATIPNSVLRLAVTLDEGGQVIIPGPEGQVQQVSFGQGLTDPVAAFTTDGYLVAAAKGEGRVYRVVENNVVHVADFERADTQPLAVLTGGTAREFVIATARQMCAYKIH